MRDNLTYNLFNDYQDNISKTLSTYTEKIVNKDKTITYKEISTSYFLESNRWNINFFSTIEQFKEQVRNYRGYHKNILFEFNNNTITKEFKFILYSKIFLEHWSLSNVFNTVRGYIIKLNEFINEKYPNINSLIELDLEKINIQWMNWLNNKNISIMSKNHQALKLGEKNILCKAQIVNFLKNIISFLKKITDKREEWEKDRWDIRNLEQYGISYNKAISVYYLDFNKINNQKIREEFKRYIKQKLIIGNHFSWSTALTYLKFIPPFVNYICQLEPSWNNLKILKRFHIEKYIEWLNIYAKNNIKRRNANPKQYIARALSTIKVFLLDLQEKEYDIAPLESIRVLIRKDDRPRVPRYDTNKINYIPDCVLQQLFDNINNLGSDIVPIVYIMYRTGLRISDVLNLKQNCLIKLNNKYWIVADIKKVYIKNHKIPIDDEIANVLEVLINTSKTYSTEDNNPDKFIFVRYKGSRKGRPYSKNWIQKKLNLLAREYNITDESGNIYYFKNHAFRHTYAVKMLNNGADILTVQELLAHASPEMTMCYSKLLDDTKRKVFDKVVKQGVFSFSESNELKDDTNGEIPSDIIDMLYTNHKLNALDTPYGTCMQRKAGKCNFAKQPPCLTCNNGNPCRDLCIGAFEGDIDKYNILINSTKNMIENAKIYNRIEMVNENTELLSLYENIYSKISQGNIIYSRIDKLKKKEVSDEQL